MTFKGILTRGTFTSVFLSLLDILLLQFICLFKRRDKCTCQTHGDGVCMGIYDESWALCIGCMIFMVNDIYVILLNNDKLQVM